MILSLLKFNKCLTKSFVSALLFLPMVAMAADQNKKPPAMPVTVTTVNQQDVPVYSDYSARALAAQQVKVYARVSGILQKKFFTEGQEVKAGQVLYKIDDRKYRALVLKAKAQVSVAEANLNQAQREYNRVKGLYKNKAVSAQEVDSALSTLELAQANLQGQKAALNETQINLDYTQVRAEISGVAGIKQQDIGSLVGSTANNSELTSITQLDKINVLFAIPDADYIQQHKAIGSGHLTALPKNQWTASIMNNENHVIAKGKIDFIDSKIDISTGSLQARAVFDNSDNHLIPGQFVRLRLTNAIRKNVFVIPQKSVLQMGDQAFVYIVKNGKVDLSPVKLAGEKNHNWLVESGLSNGDQVVNDNLIKLRPKTPVRIMPAKTSNKASK